MTDDRIAELRAIGVLVQKDKNFFTIKIGSCGGTCTSDLLRKVADLADKFGNGSVRATTRQVIEVYNIPKDNVEKALKYMSENEIPNSFSGTRLRTIVACPGDPVCRFSLANTQELAKEIKEQFGRFSGLKTKIKIGITGCRNGCAKPRENCIGLLAIGKGAWEISIGGKMGRNPSLATILKTVQNKEEAFSTIQNILTWLRDNGKEKERLSDLLDRQNNEIPAF